MSGTGTPSSIALQRTASAFAFCSAVPRRAERLWGLLAAGERLRPEDQPRELFGDHPQLVLRAGFVEAVDHRDQRADMLLG
jgi:hypothetical protein